MVLLVLAIILATVQSIAADFDIPGSAKGQNDASDILPVPTADSQWYYHYEEYWRDNFWGIYQRMVRTSMSLNMPHKDQMNSTADTETVLKTLPVFVMNLPGS